MSLVDTVDADAFFAEVEAASKKVAVKITPTRVELSQMFGTVNKRIWRG